MQARALELLKSIGLGRLLLAAALSFVAFAVAAGIAKHWGMAILSAMLALMLLSLAALTPSRLSRITAAFVLAPLAPGAASLALASDPSALLVVVPYAYFFSLPGIPVYYFMRRRRWLRFWQVAAASAGLGALGGFVIFFGLGAWLEQLKFAAFGALTGCVFWLIAFWRAAHFNGASWRSKGENAA